MHTLRCHITGIGTPRGSSRRGAGGLGCLLALAALGFALATPPPGQAAVVHCSAGNVSCLIQAITAANGTVGGDTVELEAGTYSLTAVDNETGGANGLPVITRPLTIRGVGAEATVIERAASAPPFRLVRVVAPGALTLEGLTLRGGVATFNETDFSGCFDQFSFSQQGGGLCNHRGTVTLTHCTLTDNEAEEGGGLYNAEGTVTLTHSTLAGNRAIFGAGFSNRFGTVTLAHSTVAGNQADFLGGGFTNSDGTVSITHSTLAGNRADMFGGGFNNSEGTVTLTHQTWPQPPLRRWGIPPTRIGSTAMLGVFVR